MYNAQKPDPSELPSAAQLLRSTLIALAAAVAILVTVVLPTEYGIDPTRIGRVLGLAAMGEIKQELAEEAEADRRMDAGLGDQSSALDALIEVLVPAAHAWEAWPDAVTFTLQPGEPAEMKLDMPEGGVAEYAWSAEGGRINFDLHGHGGGASVTYEKGRGKTEGEGAFTAPFAGDHGWFWRNRDDTPVTVTLQVRGDYGAFRRVE